MGWGLLGGIGKGVSEFGSMLEEKSKQDWQTKKDELAYKRQTELERLRASNNRQLSLDNRSGRQEDVRTQNKYNAKRLEEQNRYNESLLDKKINRELELHKRARIEGREDATWEVGQKLDLTEKMIKMKAKAKRETWDEMLADGTIKGTPEELARMKAAFIYNIKPAKAKVAKTPTEPQWKIANEIVNGDDSYDKLSTPERAEIISNIAWGLSADPKQTFSKLKGEGGVEDTSSYDERTDFPKLLDSARRGGKLFDNRSAALKKDVGESRYNEIMAKVYDELDKEKANRKKKKKKKRGTITDRGYAPGFTKNRKKEFEKSLSGKTKNMTPLAYSLSYENWLKDN